jgi:hypothetical protein
VEYPYSQTQFAAWQAGAAFAPPTLEARGADGQWVTIYTEFGYPAGMPRQMSVPLERLPSGVDAIRLRTNLEIYWDCVRVVYAEDCPEAVRIEAPLSQARLSHVGFPLRETGPQRLPSYDYEQREPFWDVRALRGIYTRFGTINDLVAHHDSALAIFGPGEEAHIEFDEVADPPEGWSRRFVLESHGWCKDMDLFTRFGETVAPLPADAHNGQSRQGLHDVYNVRMQSWR